MNLTIMKSFQKILKQIYYFQLPSTCFYSTSGTQHEIGKKIHCHRKRDLVYISYQ
jgi:hypothetical protein